MNSDIIQKEHLKGFCAICSEDSLLMDIPATCHFCEEFIYICFSCFKNAESYYIVIQSHIREQHKPIDLV